MSNTVQIQVENRNTDGSPNEPNSFGRLTLDVSQSKTFKQLTNKEKVVATHVILNTEGYKLTIKPADGASASTVSVNGNGTPSAVKNGDKVDIANWSVTASKV